MTKKIENSLGDLKSKVVNASDLETDRLREKYKDGGVVDICNKLSFIPSLKEGVDNYFREAWIKQVEDYCSLASILPQDLISTHKEVNKSSLKRKSAIPDEIKESKHLNWREKNKNRKTGQNET